MTRLVLLRNSANVINAFLWIISKERKWRLTISLLSSVDI